MSLLLTLLLFGGISGLLVVVVVVVSLLTDGRKTSRGDSHNHNKNFVDPEDSKSIEMQPLTKKTSNPRLTKFSLIDTEDMEQEKLQNRGNENSEETNLQQIYPILSHIRNEQNIPEDKKKSDSIGVLQKLRDLQLNLITQQGDISEIHKCSLIISVFSTASSVAGYCVNIPEKSVEFYALPVDELPKMTEAADDLIKPDIASMNKLFALYLWKHSIINLKKLRFYTSAQYENENEITKQISSLTNGLKLYSGMEIEYISEDWKINPETYAASVLPAEDLAKWKLRAFEKFVSFQYGISRVDFKGTQELPNPDLVEFEHISEFRKSAMSDRFIERVRKQMTTGATSNEKMFQDAE